MKRIIIVTTAAALVCHAPLNAQAQIVTKDTGTCDYANADGSYAGHGPCRPATGAPPVSYGNVGGMTPSQAMMYSLGTDMLTIMMGSMFSSMFGSSGSTAEDIAAQQRRELEEQQARQRDAQRRAEAAERQRIALEEARQRILGASGLGDGRRGLSGVLDVERAAGPLGTTQIVPRRGLVLGAGDPPLLQTAGLAGTAQMGPMQRAACVRDYMRRADLAAARQDYDSAAAISTQAHQILAGTATPSGPCEAGSFDIPEVVDTTSAFPVPPAVQRVADLYRAAGRRMADERMAREKMEDVRKQREAAELERQRVQAELERLRAQPQPEPALPPPEVVDAQKKAEDAEAALQRLEDSVREQERLVVEAEKQSKEATGAAEEGFRKYSIDFSGGS